MNSAAARSAGGNSGGNSVTLNQQCPYTTGITENYFIPALAPAFSQREALRLPKPAQARRFAGFCFCRARRNACPRSTVQAS